MIQLLAVTTYEVGRYAQVVAICSIPVIILTVSGIIWLHYRRRKKLDPEELQLRETIHQKIKLQAMENEFKQTDTDVRYLQDMLQEKQLQIEFLQNQLSQRIRNFHDVEAREEQIRQELKQKEDVLNELKYQVSLKAEDLARMEDKLQQQAGFLSGLQEHLSQGIEQLKGVRDKHAPLVAVG
jgi:chromosome segregation ATPase